MPLVKRGEFVNPVEKGRWKLAAVNAFQFTPKNSSQVRCLVAHGVLINGRKFLKCVQGHLLGQVLHHAKDALIEISIDLSRGLQILQSKRS